MRSTSIIIATKKNEILHTDSMGHFAGTCKICGAREPSREVSSSGRLFYSIGQHHQTICNMNVYILHIVVYILYTVWGGGFFLHWLLMQRPGIPIFFQCKPPCSPVIFLLETNAKILYQQKSRIFRTGYWLDFTRYSEVTVGGAPPWVYEG